MYSTFVINLLEVPYVFDPSGIEFVSMYDIGSKGISTNVDHKSNYYLKTYVETILPHGLHIMDFCLIRYQMGSRFEKHRDLRIDETHCGAVLLYPPCAYGGGELIIGDRVIKNIGTHFMLVFISLTDEHEVAEITSGTRYVYLSPCFTAPQV